VSQALIEAIAGIQEDEALKIAQDLLEGGTEPQDVLDHCRQGMEIIGVKFEKGEYFMPELIMSGEILAKISEMAKPMMKKDAEHKTLGKIVIGTVEGDIHDLAKDIVVFMLEIGGFEVHDVGVDVPPAVFVAKLQEVGANILGLSGFLHLASESMQKTIEALKIAGMRDDVKVMIGGGQIDDFLKEFTGADDWGNNAMAAVSIAKRWATEGGA
jgi:methanogenic corrinoid protein MtbC1